VRAFLGHRGSITAMALSNDGQYLASAGEDLAINLWDLGSGSCIKKMTGHTASIYSLAFSAESSLLVSGGSDWTVRCWDVKDAGGRQSHVNGMMNGRANGISSQYGLLPMDIEPQQNHNESGDLLATFPTKRTSIVNVQFTPRNLCMVAGASQQ